MPDAYGVVVPERRAASVQHHLVGDVGDFGKYGLLRALTGTWPVAEPRLSLGVGRDVVFLDPDKGLAPPSAGLSSTEHAYVRELEAFVQNGQTVVVYHHLGRTATHPVQMRDWASGSHESFGLTPSRTSCGTGGGRLAPTSSYQPTLTPRRSASDLSDSGGASGSSAGTSLRC